jgi:hypothetical protein
MLSASTTASGNDTPRSGSSCAKTRRSPTASCSAGTSSLRATAAKIFSRSRSAAWIAALPAISVTREE